MWKEKHHSKLYLRNKKHIFGSRCILNCCSNVFISQVITWIYFLHHPLHPNVNNLPSEGQGRILSSRCTSKLFKMREIHLPILEWYLQASDKNGLKNIVDACSSREFTCWHFFIFPINNWLKICKQYLTVIHTEVYEITMNTRATCLAEKLLKQLCSMLRDKDNHNLVHDIGVENPTRSKLSDDSKQQCPLPWLQTHHDMTHHILAWLIDQIYWGYVSTLQDPTSFEILRTLGPPCCTGQFGPKVHKQHKYSYTTSRWLQRKTHWNWSNSAAVLIYNHVQFNEKADFWGEKGKEKEKHSSCEYLI